MYLLTKAQIKTHKPKCVFEYYSREKGEMVNCGKPAVFRFGIKINNGICAECSRHMEDRGVLTVGSDGFEYTSSREVLEKFGGYFEKETKDLSEGVL
jgi:hypothetical protein